MENKENTWVDPKVKELEWRMYGLVPYNLSPIQQAIQYGHAVVEYMIDNYRYGDLDLPCTKWAERDKTFIILNGGTSNDSRLIDGVPHGSLNNYKDDLLVQGITHASFREPDIQNALTAVVFLADERVWNYEKYPDQTIGGGTENSLMYILPESDEDYEKRLGGKDNVWLRNFLKQFRLA